MSKAILGFGFDDFILTNGAQVIKEFAKRSIAEFEKLNIRCILQGELY